MADTETCAQCGRTFVYLSSERGSDASNLCITCRSNPMTERCERDGCGEVLVQVRIGSLGRGFRYECPNPDHGVNWRAEQPQPQPHDLGYISQLAGVVSLPERMNCSLADFAQSIRVLLEEEQAKPMPNNALIGVLCNAARLGWEQIEMAKAKLPQPQPRVVEERSVIADFLDWTQSEGLELCRVRKGHSPDHDFTPTDALIEMYLNTEMAGNNQAEGGE